MSEKLKKLIIIGGGAGMPEYLLPVAKQEIEKADCVIASERLIKNLNIKNGEVLGKIPEFLNKLPERLKQENIALLVSGDPLLYSLCRTIQKKYPAIDLEIIPAVSSLQVLGAKFGLTMENAVIVSLHGRNYSTGKIAYTVSENFLTFFLCSAKQGVKEIANILVNYDLKNTELFVGINLSYPEQELLQGKPELFLNFNHSALCVVAVKNTSPKLIKNPVLLPDSAFLRNNSPMTKEEIRAIVLNKLRLQPDFITWDIGAGTGSISVECARFCQFGQVYAIEYKNSALEILEKNKNYFQLANLIIISGKASEKIKKLPLPDCIFIGGTGGEFQEIFKQIKNLNQKIRLVISAVTLESQAEIYPVLKNFPDLEITRISISHAKAIKNYHILQENHPILIYSCTIGAE